MVTINGLAPTVVQRNQKTNKKTAVNREKGEDNRGQTTKVAAAVSQSIRQLSDAELERAQVHYDLPKGQSRKAMQEYMAILNRAKQEELAGLIGVDLYI
jgi:hypothetical protein